MEINRSGSGCQNALRRLFYGAPYAKQIGRHQMWMNQQPDSTERSNAVLPCGVTTEIPNVPMSELTEPGLSLAPAAQHIIWIASYPKSGNTWVRAFIHNLLKEIGGDTKDVPHDINRMNEHTTWELLAEPYEKLLGKPITQAHQAEIARVRPEVQRRLANSRPTPFFAKTHLCLGQDYRYPTINLDATLAVIYLVRNPLDVTISYAHHSAQSIDGTILHMKMPNMKVPGNENNVYEVLGSWSQHVGSWLGLSSRPVFLMRYEDMLANPERSFALLARFLRLRCSHDQLKSAIEKSSFGELRRQEQERGFIEKPATAEKFFRDGRAGQWKQNLSEAQINTICAAHGPMMQRLGYLPADCGDFVFRGPGARGGAHNVEGRIQ